MLLGLRQFPTAALVQAKQRSKGRRLRLSLAPRSGLQLGHAPQLTADQSLGVIRRHWAFSNAVL